MCVTIYKTSLPAQLMLRVLNALAGHLGLIQGGGEECQGQCLPKNRPFLAAAGTCLEGKSFHCRGG